MSVLEQAPKPVIKIVGGKSRLIKTLVQHLPKDFNEKEYKYIEPFLGGASFGLYLLHNAKNLGQAYFNEFNFDLYNVYKTITVGVDSLIKELDLRKEKNTKEFFLGIRSKFTEYSVIRGSKKVQSKNFFLKRAADFIYLNKNCFNGLIRYNKMGKFNTPYGKYPKPPAIYDRSNLEAVSKALKGVTLTHNDFEMCIRDLLDEGKLDATTFIYMDPPYVPQSLTSCFVDYTPNGFGYSDHVRMKILVDDLTKVGVKVLISNSDTPTTREIYKEYKLESVYNSRSVGAKGSTRGKIRELLIKNY